MTSDDSDDTERDFVERVLLPAADLLRWEAEMYDDAEDDDERRGEDTILSTEADPSRWNEGTPTAAKDALTNLMEDGKCPDDD